MAKKPDNYDATTREMIETHLQECKESNAEIRQALKDLHEQLRRRFFAQLFTFLSACSIPKMLTVTACFCVIVLVSAVVVSGQSKEILDRLIDDAPQYIGVE